MTLSTMLSAMGEGMLRSCAIFFLTILFSMPLGMVIMFLRRSRLKLVSAITKIYIAIMRGTPLMLQLLMWYFGPYYLFGMSIRGYRFPAIIIGFSMNYAAYFAEIYRGGMETIPQGQYEAAEVLGYSKTQTFFKIILPLSKSGLSTLAIYNGVSMWNEFAFANTFLITPEKKTLPLALGQFKGEHSLNIPINMAVLTLSVLPMIILFIVFQDKLVKGMMAGAVKG